MVLLYSQWSITMYYVDATLLNRLNYIWNCVKYITANTKIKEQKIIERNVQKYLLLSTVTSWKGSSFCNFGV